MALKPQTYTPGNLVEKHINTAYDTVRAVSLYLNEIAIIAVTETLNDLSTVGDNISDVNLVAADINAGKIDAAIAAAISTAADLIATNADVVLTNADAVSTAADRVQVTSDAAQVAADLVSVASIFDQFDDIYLGAKAVDPTLDNDGDPLTAGDIYWNTAESEVRFYNGAAWERPEAAASTSAAAALAAQVAAELALDTFDDIYLGSKTVAPTLDNDGDPLQTGALYWHSTNT